MKKNGFTLVELIVTFTLVSTISFLLFQLIFGLKEMYISTKFKTNLLTKQANMTHRINSDFLNYKVIKFDNCTSNGSDVSLCMEFTFADEESKLFTKRLEVHDDKIIYDNYKMDVKSSQDGSTIGTIKIKNSFLNSSIYLYNSILNIEIPITNSLASGDYGLHLTIQYNNIPDSLNTSGQVLTERFKDLINSEAEIVVTSISANDLIRNTVTTNDGLYDAKYSEDWYQGLTNSETNKIPRYVYKGDDPKNYVLLKNQCYRILSINKSLSMKLIYEGESNGDNCDMEGNDNSYLDASGELSAWGSSNNNWTASPTQNIKVTIDDWYQESNFTSKRMGSFTNRIGMVSEAKVAGTDTVQGAIADELGTIGPYEKVALPNVSDYLLASSNEHCNGIKVAKETTECMKNNFLYKSGYNYWTLTGVDGTSNRVWAIQSNGKIAPTAINATNLKVRPVIFLKNTATFMGSGLAADPYKLK